MVMEQSQNLFPQDPDLKSLLDLFRKQLLTDLYCHQVGVIQEFFPETQTATVQIAYKKTRFRQNQSGIVEPELIAYPPLKDVPCFFAGGAGGFMTIPVEEGDECLICFNDRCFDSWFEGNIGAAVPSPRLHSISDGFALIGIRNKTLAISPFDQERARFQRGTAVLAVGKDDKILAENANFDLKTLLTDFTSQVKDLTDELKSLTDTLQTLTVTGVTGGPGTSGPPDPATVASLVAAGLAIQAIGTQIDTTGTGLGGLLE